MAALLVAVLVPSCVSAQERVVIRGVGDATFGSLNTTHLFGGGVGFNIDSVWQVVIEAAREFGRAEPRRPPVAPAGFIFIPARVVFLFPTSVRVDRYLTGGMRLHVPTSARAVRPFVEGHAGVSRLTTRFEPNDGAIEGQVLTQPAVLLGGGVSITVAPRVGVEVGYRYGRLFNASGDTNMSNAGVGIAVGF